MPKPRHRKTKRLALSAAVAFYFAVHAFLSVVVAGVFAGIAHGGVAAHGGDTPVGDGVVVVSYTIVVALVVAVVAAIAAAVGWMWFALKWGIRNGRGGGLVVRVAGRLLPATVRETYVEEWLRWLYDLRVDGAPWYRRLLELVSIVLAVPWLAVTLRLARQRAVD